MEKTSQYLVIQHNSESNEGNDQWHAFIKLNPNPNQQNCCCCKVHQYVVTPFPYPSHLGGGFDLLTSCQQYWLQDLRIVTFRYTTLEYYLL